MQHVPHRILLDNFADLIHLINYLNSYLYLLHNIGIGAGVNYILDSMPDEYEITYEVDGVTYNKWFDLYPGVELGDIFGEGTSVLIKYSQAEPDVFDVVSVLDESNIMMF